MSALVRYCHECSHVGDVPPGKRDCCPDGSHAVMVPPAVAEQARLGFGARLRDHEASLLPEGQRRRYRVAATLCACHMTDGFCSPLNKPECHCWRLADTVIRAVDDWPAPAHLKACRV